jgi:aminoglycoside phosphotransferase (APT) family kinase protein
MSSERPLIVLEGIAPYVPGEGEIKVTRIGDGHSNETFALARGGVRSILRRPPRPPYAPRAHDVLREHTILAALRDSQVRAPRPLARCEDVTVIGAPFYVMEHVEGVVVRERFPPALDVPAQRRRALEGFVDGLVAIHAVPWRGTALEQIGRPSGYLERQLRLWRGQWERNATRRVADIERMADWLERHVPRRSETTLVHGDYKLDNVLFALRAPARVEAVLDWEMSTLGDPLADLGFLSATYAQADGERDEVLDFAAASLAAGAPKREELLERYAHGSGRQIGDLRWYEGFALWKLAILFEASYRRHLDGRAADPFFARLERGVPRIAARALRCASPQDTPSG